MGLSQIERICDSLIVIRKERFCSFILVFPSGFFYYF